MRGKRWLGGCCAGVVACVLMSGGTALAAPVACGDTITVDTKLKADLIDCPGDGLVIGASDVTLDLNGHVIDGDGVTGFPEDQDVGVVSERNATGVVIRGGTAQEFDIGVYVTETHGSRVLDLTAQRNSLGVVVIVFAAGRLARNAVLDNTFVGLALQHASDDNRIDHNRVSGNGSGIELLRSERNRVEKNVVAGNGGGIGLTESSENEVHRNLVQDSAGSGVLLSDTARTVVSRNVVVRSGEGITMRSDTSRVVRNRITDSGTGLLLQNGDDNVVAQNVIQRTDDAGIRVLFAPAPLGGTFNNVFDANVVLDAGTDGVAMDASDRVAGTVLQRNIVIGAADDGIDVDAPSITLRRNLAFRNGDLGIEAVPGVIDAGGNDAFANGNPLQCENVLCAP